MIGARAGTPGATRQCPHCRATILESSTVCPGCRHHLRFDKDAKPGAAAAPRLVWQVEGSLAPELPDAVSEYWIVLTVRNERNEEITRQLVNVGALQGADRRVFSLGIEMLPPKPGAARRR